jgi:hypothetical protein
MAEPTTPEAAPKASLFAGKFGPVPKVVVYVGVPVAAYFIYKYVKGSSAATAATAATTAAPGVTVAGNTSGDNAVSRQADVASTHAESTAKDVRARLLRDEKKQDKENERLQEEIDDTRKHVKDAPRSDPTGNADVVTTAPQTSNGKAAVDQPQGAAARDVNLTAAPAAATTVQPAEPHNATVPDRPA